MRVEEDGFTHDQAYFTLNPRANVRIQIPAQWTALGTPASLVLRLPASTGSILRLEASSLTPNVLFEGQGLESYRKLVIADLPPGATDVRLDEEKIDPLPIFHWTDHEFSVQFALFGQLYQSSIVFINIDPQQQLRMTIVAPKGVFNRVHEAGFELLQSWQQMENARFALKARYRGKAPCRLRLRCNCAAIRARVASAIACSSEPF